MVSYNHLSALESMAPIELTAPAVRKFRSTVMKYYRQSGRKYPWRETSDPYRILVSELMLQQTQTERVIPKYQSFIEALPSIHHVAACNTDEILRLWSGLGYYRRALNLKRAAQQIRDDFQGTFPQTRAELEGLAGVGSYTAGAICNFAFNRAEAIIETNIRTVFLHLFLPKGTAVNDREILELVRESMDLENPKEWFYALMDLGAVIKRIRPKVNHRSAHHSVQSKFKGSHRQKRASVLRTLTTELSLTVSTTAKALGVDTLYAKQILDELQAEGFLAYSGRAYKLRKD